MVQKNVVYLHRKQIKIEQMTREERFQQFVRANTNEINGRILRCYRDRYGDMPMEEAFEIHDKEVQAYMAQSKRVDELERWLWTQGVSSTQSRVSESRYYTYNGVKIRFSSHIYPTGSMTDRVMKVYDMCADKHLLDELLELIDVKL